MHESLSTIGYALQESEREERGESEERGEERGRGEREGRDEIFYAIREEGRWNKSVVGSATFREKNRQHLHGPSE